MEKDGKSFIVKDGVEIGKEYDYVGFPTFSPDSKNFSYMAQKDGKSLLVIQTCNDLR